MFFIGDDEDGYGQIFVTLCDSVSEVFDHCAQVVDTLKMTSLKVTVLVLQNNGGPDHSLKRVTTKFALLAMAKMLNINHLVVLRCAPNGSAMNKVEREMSLLNLPLAHTTIMRGNMAPWAEKATTGVNGMTTECTIATKLAEARNEALARIPSLREEVIKDCFDC